jgi:hypothetical protein
MPGPIDEHLQHQIDAEALVRARRVIEGMESSISWRVTKPLRSAKGATRRG